MKYRNSSKKSSTFGCIPLKLKQAEVIPLYKKLDPLNKENYRQVRPLLHLSKVFERIIYKRINCYMEDKLTKCLTGFRKLHATEQSLLTVLDNWKRRIENGAYAPLYLWIFQMPLMESTMTLW